MSDNFYKYSPDFITIINYMMQKSKSIILIIFIYFALLLTGCSDNKADTEQEKHLPLTTYEENTAEEVETVTNTSNEQVIHSSDEETYIGLAQYEPEFKLGDYPMIYKTEYAILRAAKDCMTQAELEQAGTDIDNVVEKLEACFGTTLEEKWDFDITYFIRPGELPRFIGPYDKPVIFLNPVNGRIPLYAHETTHLMAGSNVNSTWMAEGLAVYFNSEFSSYPTWPQLDLDLDKLAKKRYEEGYDKIITFENETHYEEKAVRSTTGEAYYVLAGSFVKYLVIEIGIEKYLTIYNRQLADDGLKEETGKTLIEWKTEWLEYLKTLEES